MNESTHNELFKLECRYWQAIKDRDVDAALALTADPCLVAGASGVAKVDQDSFKRIMNAAKYTLKKFALTDAKSHQLSDDVAILAYKVHEDLIVDGKPVSIDASDASTWVRQDGEWKIALHTESLLGDSFGRDRKVH